MQSKLGNKKLDNKKTQRILIPQKWIILMQKNPKKTHDKKKKPLEFLVRLSLQLKPPNNSMYIKLFLQTELLSKLSHDLSGNSELSINDS